MYNCVYFFFLLRGKGDYYRLGHGTDSHVRKPQLVEGLKGHKIVDVAVGALHCLAVTEEGKVRQIKKKMAISALWKWFEFCLIWLLQGLRLGRQ